MKRILFVCLSVFTLSACGGTVCDRVKAAQDKFYDGKTECKYMSNGASIGLTRGTATCKTDGCSASDQEAMDKYVTCTNNAPPCTSGKEEAAVAAGIACGVQLQAANISAACQDNFK